MSRVRSTVPASGTLRGVWPLTGRSAAARPGRLGRRQARPEERPAGRRVRRSSSWVGSTRARSTARTRDSSPCGTCSPGADPPPRSRAVTLVFVPVFNVDGHERFGPNQRPNQRGPRRDRLSHHRAEPEPQPRLDQGRGAGDGRPAGPAGPVGSGHAGRPPRHRRGQVRARRGGHRLAGGAVPAGLRRGGGRPEREPDGRPARARGHLPLALLSLRFAAGNDPGERHRAGPLVAPFFQPLPGRTQPDRRPGGDAQLAPVSPPGAHHPRRPGIAAGPGRRAGRQPGRRRRARPIGRAPGWPGTRGRRSPSRAAPPAQTIEFRGYAFTRQPSEISGGTCLRYDEGRPQIWQVPLHDRIAPRILVAGARRRLRGAGGLRRVGRARSSPSTASATSASSASWPRRQRGLPGRVRQFR